MRVAAMKAQMASAKVSMEGTHALPWMHSGACSAHRTGRDGAGVTLLSTQVTMDQARWLT